MFVFTSKDLIPLFTQLESTFLFFPHLVSIYLDFIFLGAYSCCHCLWLYQISLKGKGEQKDPWLRNISENKLAFTLSAVSE